MQYLIVDRLMLHIINLYPFSYTRDFRGLTHGDNVIAMSQMLNKNPFLTLRTTCAVRSPNLNSTVFSSLYLTVEFNLDKCTLMGRRFKVLLFDS